MTKMVAARALARMLKGYEISHVFMVPAVLRRTMVELEEAGGVLPMHVHGEKAAAYMADGYARITGKPGICAAQHIGTLNLAAGLRDAWLAKSPVIALTGGRDPNTKFRQVYQEVDDIAAFDPVTKLNATVDVAERIPDMMRQAVRTALSGTPGPVHLQFRGNEAQIDQEEIAADPYVEPAFARVPPHRPAPDPGQTGEALRLLQSAARPVIVAGGGVRASRAGAELVKLAEALNIPVATSLNGKDVIPGTHPLSVGVVGTYSRASANRVVNRADLVCYIGSETGGMVTHFWQVPAPGVDVVQIDINPLSLGRNYPLRAGVLGDARKTIEEMLANLDRSSAERRAEWVSEAQSMCRDWRAQEAHNLTSDAQPIRPERICAELSSTLPDDAVAVVDTGHGGMWMGGMFDIKAPTQSYLRSAGHLGWAFPAALGVKCGVPDRPVVCFTGDAGFWYHIGDLETAVRFGISTVTIVNNNGSGNQSKRGFDRFYETAQTDFGRSLWTFRDVNFAKIAEVIGATGIRVENPRDIAPAIEKALSCKGPVVLDIVTDIDALAPLAVI